MRLDICYDKLVVKIGCWMSALCWPELNLFVSILIFCDLESIKFLICFPYTGPTFELYL